METNPYQSPQPIKGVVVEACDDDAALIAAARRQLAPVGWNIIVLSSFSLVFAIDGFVIELLWDPPSRMLKLGAIEYGILLMIYSFQIYCVVKLLTLQSRSWAYAGAVMVCIPCMSPCIVLGIPFGVWALCLIATPEIERAFELNRP